MAEQHEVVGDCDIETEKKKIILNNEFMKACGTHINYNFNHSCGGIIPNKKKKSTKIMNAGCTNWLVQHRVKYSFVSSSHVIHLLASDSSIDLAFIYACA